MQDLSEVLAQLRDIHEPDPITWWPPTLAWWLLLLAIVVCLVLIGLYIRKRLRSLKRVASLELKAIVRNFNIHQSDERLLKDVSVFLRRVALHDEQGAVAGVTGKQWLQYLDSLSTYSMFTDNYADLLLSGPYQASIEFDAKFVLKDLDNWVRKLK